jgi:hypothetical protein
MQDNEPGSPAPDQDYGANTPESFANYDPDTCLWKTYQLCLFEDYQLYSETWPRSGMMRNGSAYPQPPLVRLIDVTDSSLWATPAASWYERGQTSLPVWEKRQAARELAGKARFSDPLHIQVAKRRLFPTPTARDWRSGKASQATMDRNSRPLSEVIGGQLNPTWVEWLMGFPIGWTDLED